MPSLILKEQVSWPETVLDNLSTGHFAGCRFSILLRSGKGTQEETLLGFEADRL